jgi:hypothetical protein
MFFIPVSPGAAKQDDLRLTNTEREARGWRRTSPTI